MPTLTPGDRGWIEARCRVLVENALDVIFTIDQGGTCTFFNRRVEHVTGRRLADLTGLHVTELVTEEQRDHVWRQCQRALGGEDLGPFEFEVSGCAPGARRTLEVALRPVFDGPVIVAVDAIARDVTSRNALEAAMRHEQKMNAVSRLAAGVAHDFNNLLGVILGHVEATAPMTEHQPALQPAVDSIRAAAERAASLTGHLLVLSQRQVVQSRVLDLNQVVASSRPLLERLVGDRITLALQLAADVGPVRADAAQLRQVVANLAINAQAAMPGGGRVSFATNNVDIDEATALARPAVPPGRYVVLTVSDTGVGIDPAALEWIFEPFFSTKASRAAGLGLSTVYTIVHQCGGTIDVESRRGNGTAFRLYFPRLAAPAPPPDPEPVASGGSETVLLVEDEPDLREILAQLLASRGYTVVAAATAAECLEACRRLAAPPRLLVSDVVLPGMGGRELATDLVARYPSMQVLFISGYTDDAALLESVQRGAQFLQKPFGLQDFAVRVRDILDDIQGNSSPAD
ncbi:MAG TPA: response regulator [Vicinamibacterales bacterium]|nr:response regulator [Vicinamibacterales bacterium]